MGWLEGAGPLCGPRERSHSGYSDASEGARFPIPGSGSHDRRRTWGTLVREVRVDTIGLDLDLDLDLDDDHVPPGLDEPSEPSPRPTPAPSASPSGRGLLTFLVVLFGFLELQTILVLFSAADGAGTLLVTYAFGAIFMASVFSWFFIGMLWFARKWEEAQGRGR